MSLIISSTNRLKRWGGRCASAGAVQSGVAGTGISITDTPYQRIYQRVGTSKTVTVAGTYTGTPSSIQARHCPSGTATSALSSTYPWSSLVNNPTGGTFSASYSVPQGEGWVVQVRDGVNNSLAASGTHVFSVAAVIALIGQSNMENLFGVYEGAFCGAKGAFSYHGALARLGNINDNFPPNTLVDQYNGHGSDYVAAGYTSDPGAYIGTYFTLLANTLVASLGCPVVFLPRAASGSNIQSWLPEQTYLNALLNDVTAIGSDFEHAIWLQGENNATESMSAATYQGHLQTVFNACKTHTGRSSSQFHFGVVVVGPATNVWTGGDERMGPIRKGQLDFVAANVSNGAYLAGTCVDGNLAGASTVHIDTPSLRRQASRYAEAIKRRSSAATYGIEGPKIASASRTGAVVTVNITHRGGSALLDGAGGSGSGLQGFRVFDGGTPCTISTTAISGNTVVLTLSATPSGGVTMDYAMANAPFGSTTSSNAVCYDNQVIPGDTLGLPLQPEPLMAVTEI